MDASDSHAAAFGATVVESHGTANRAYDESLECTYHLLDQAAWLCALAQLCFSKR
jgi:hypothetical protein